MIGKPGDGWTEERTEAVKANYVAGLSASQSAKALGGVTRCAVIGKLSRLGFVFDRAPSAPRASPPPSASAHG